MVLCICIKIGCQYHGMVGKTENKDNGQQAVRTTKNTFYARQFCLACFAMVDYLGSIFTFVFYAKLLYRIFFTVYANFPVQFKADHIVLIQAIEEAKHIVIIITSIHGESYMAQFSSAG